MGLRERNAASTDYPSFTRAWGELGLAQAVPDSTTWLVDLAPHSFFLEDERGVQAYAMARSFGEHGDVRQVVVFPEARRRGVGRALMAALARRLREAGCTRWQLDVRADNAAALALYRAVGLATIGEQTTVRLRRSLLDDSPASSLRVLPPARDGELETGFALPPGLLAGLRARQRHSGPILELPEARGVARHLPDFAPGVDLVWPFRLHGPAGALAFLAGVVPDDAAATIEVTAEDPGVAGALIDAGARVSERLLVLRGDL